MRWRLSSASRTDHVVFDFMTKRTMPASRSKSANRTFLATRRAASAATWHANVVAPQPPFADRKPTILPRPADVADEPLERAADKFSNASRNVCVRGG